VRKLLLLLLIFGFLISCNTKASTKDSKDSSATLSVSKDNTSSLIKEKSEKIAKKSDKKVNKKSEKTFMWKVEGGKSVVYLLGSIHAAKPSLYPLNEKITKAYEESKNLVVEVDIEENKFAVQMKVMQLGMYNNKTLKDVLPKDVYSNLTKRAQEIGLTILAISKMKPWLASLSLVMFKMKELGYDPEHGIDLFFLKKAKKEKKNIIELETAIFQLEMLSSFSEKLNILNIKLMLEDWDKMGAELAKMFAQWKIGETQAMSDLTTKYVKKYPEFKGYNKKLLTDRNIDMTKKVDGMLKGKKTSYFVIVGGGHLIGKSGIIELLRKKGYKVVQQ